MGGLRRSLHVTQQAVASKMGVAQSHVSAIERSALPSIEVGTLAAYVEALGGRLELVADFEDERITLAGWE
nr:helix-turn-helix domain-containing protein [Cellulomonas sp. JH27-2]